MPAGSRADIPVGDAFLSGEIGDGGDVAALKPVPPVPRATDGAQQAGVLAAIHGDLDLLGRQDAGSASYCRGASRSSVISRLRNYR